MDVMHLKSETNKKMLGSVLKYGWPLPKEVLESKEQGFQSDVINFTNSKGCLKKKNEHLLFCQFVKKIVSKWNAQIA